MSGTLTVIKVNGAHEEHRYEKSGYPNLMEVVRPLLHGGWIERVKVKWNGRIRDAFVDEDGISKELAYNEAATKVLATVYAGQSIVGPMVVWQPDGKVKKEENL